MKKDYIPVETLAEVDEIKFVEEFWTRKWGEREIKGLSEQQFAELEAREELRFMTPYLSGIPSESRILDGGCGLGEWTLYKNDSLDLILLASMSAMSL